MKTKALSLGFVGFCFVELSGNFARAPGEGRKIKNDMREIERANVSTKGDLLQTDVTLQRDHGCN